MKMGPIKRKAIEELRREVRVIARTMGDIQSPTQKVIRARWEALITWGEEEVPGDVLLAQDVLANPAWGEDVLNKDTTAWEAAKNAMWGYCTGVALPMQSGEGRH